MLGNEGDALARAVVCPPREEYFRVSEPASHNIREAADPQKARSQHRNLVRVMRDFGCIVVEVPELPGHPNSVFTRDTAVCTPRGYVKVSMGLPTRSGEESWMANILDSLHEPCAGVIEEPGTLEGGDVIIAGEVAFVGRSARTNDEGARQIAGLLNDTGYEVRTARVPEPFLHIGGAMSIVAPGTVICCRGVFPERFFAGFETLEIPCSTFTGSNVICLGNGELICDASSRETEQLLVSHGYTVHPVDLREFAKGKGGATCLILPVERRDDAASP